MKLWPFIQSAAIPPARRAYRLRRGVALLPPTLGTLHVVEALCDVESAIGAAEAGELLDPNLLALAGALTWPWRRVRRLSGGLRWALHAWRVRPRTQGEAVAVIEWLLQATEAPPRYRSADEGKPSMLKPASSSAMRLALRAAALHQAPEALAGVRSIFDVPARDAIAWLVAADELDGAHFVDFETHKRNEEYLRREAENGTGEA